MKQLVAGTLVLSLIASNIIMAENYIINKRKFDQKVINQGKIIKNLKKNLQESTELDKKKDVKIHILSSELNKVKNQLDQSQKQNAELQNSLKQSKVRKEVSAAKKKINVIATAYTSNCSGCSGLTYTEYNVKNTIEYNGLRIIAADTTLIPLYSIVRIDTETQSFNAIVIDTGGAIRDHKIDVLVHNYDEAVQFGKQNVIITILRNGKG